MKQFNARFRMKSDTTANWLLHRDFIPLKGEIIIYTDYQQVTDNDNNIINIPAIKIGDGLTYGVDLPFINDDIREDLLSHISDTNIHTNLIEKNFWNNKINVNDSQEVVEGSLIFNRN